MEWTDAGVEGAKRFLNRIWRLFAENPKVEGEFKPEGASKDELKLYSALQKTIKAVRDDLEEFGFNTAIARLMELLNALYGFGNKRSTVFSRALCEFIKLLAPFAPHLAEELWHSWAGHEESVFENPLPEPDERYLVEEEVEIPVQVNGRVRARLTIPRGASQEEVLKRALELEPVKKHVGGKEIRKVIYVQDRLLNIVV